MKLNLAYKKRQTEGIQNSNISKSEMEDILGGDDVGEMLDKIGCICSVFCPLYAPTQMSFNAGMAVGSYIIVNQQ